MKILIVDDDFISRSKMQKILESFGECEVAENGENAIMAFNMAIQFGAPFDLISLDIEMPDISGIEVLGRIRDIEKESEILKEKQVKVLMVTSYSDEDKVLGSIKAGCNNYIVKPFDKEKVTSKLKSLGFDVG